MSSSKEGVRFDDEFKQEPVRLLRSSHKPATQLAQALQFGRLDIIR